MKATEDKRAEKADEGREGFERERSSKEAALQEIEFNGRDFVSNLEAKRKAGGVSVRSSAKRRGENGTNERNSRVERFKLKMRRDDCGRGWIRS